MGRRDLCKSVGAQSPCPSTMDLDQIQIQLAMKERWPLNALASSCGQRETLTFDGDGDCGLRQELCMEGLRQLKRIAGS